jgi:glycosyltransferase involved in cell wall biosynthesis
VSERRHVLLLEGELSGHHSVYLERIAEGFLDAGNDVTIAVSERATLHPAVLRLRERFSGRVFLSWIESASLDRAKRSRFGEVGRELLMWQIFGRCYREVHSTRTVDYVFLPYVDYCLYAIGLIGSPFGRTRWGGICMRPSFHYSKLGVMAPRPRFAWLKERLIERLISADGLVRLFSIDELLVGYLLKAYPSARGRVRYVPDPAEFNGAHTRHSARVALAVSEKAFVVLVYGAIDARKGLDALLAACAKPGIPESVCLLVVGRQDQWAEDQFKTAEARQLQLQGRIRVINDFVSDECQQMAFSACDCVWLGYRNHFTMSGVLVLAALSGRPAIATKDGLIGWHTASKELGLVVDVASTEQIEAAIMTVLNGWRSNSRYVSDCSWSTAIDTLLEA